MYHIRTTKEGKRIYETEVDGKVFTLYGTCDTETTARVTADAMKDQGFETRIINIFGKPAVWTHPFPFE